jgi:hypothetical protein
MLCSGYFGCWDIVSAQESRIWGNSRLWRIDPKADYSPLNGVSRHRINADLILQHLLYPVLERSHRDECERAREIQAFPRKVNLATAAGVEEWPSIMKVRGQRSFREVEFSQHLRNLGKP